jgi:hypothetical protein
MQVAYEVSNRTTVEKRGWYQQTLMVSSEPSASQLNFQVRLLGEDKWRKFEKGLEDRNQDSTIARLARYCT